MLQSESLYNNHRTFLEPSCAGSRTCNVKKLERTPSRVSSAMLGWLGFDSTQPQIQLPGHHLHYFWWRGESHQRPVLRRQLCYEARACGYCLCKSAKASCFPSCCRMEPLLHALGFVTLYIYFSILFLFSLLNTFYPLLCFEANLQVVGRVLVWKRVHFGLLAKHVSKKEIAW